MQPTLTDPHADLLDDVEAACISRRGRRSKDHAVERTINALIDDEALAAANYEAAQAAWRNAR